MHLWKLWPDFFSSTQFSGTVDTYVTFNVKRTCMTSPILISFNKLIEFNNLMRLMEVTVCFREAMINFLMRFRRFFWTYLSISKHTRMLMHCLHLSQMFIPQILTEPCQLYFIELRPGKSFSVFQIFTFTIQNVRGGLMLPSIGA